MSPMISFISFPVEEREVRLPTTSPRWVAQILGRVKMGRGGRGWLGQERLSPPRSASAPSQSTMVYAVQWRPRSCVWGTSVSYCCARPLRRLADHVDLEERRHHLP